MRRAALVLALLSAWMAQPASAILVHAPIAGDSPAACADDGNTTFSITTSTATGPAPLAVHFAANDVADPQTTKDWHHLGALWDFDDASGTWNVSGESRNVAHGFMAGHVFESPGSYTVTLSVTDPTDGTCTAGSALITVQDPDALAEYTGTETACVDPAGTFDPSWCPPGSDEITTSDFATAMASHNAAGKRIIIEGGSSLTLASNGFGFADASSARSILEVRGGSGRATLNTPGGADNGTIALFHESHWTISNLDIVSAGGSLAWKASGNGGTIDETLFHGVTMTDFDQCFTNATNGVDEPVSVYLIESSSSSVVCLIDTTGGGGSTIFGADDGSMYMGVVSNIRKAPGTEFNFRAVYLSRTLIQHVHFTGTTGARNTLQIRGCGDASAPCASSPLSEYVIVGSSIFDQMGVRVDGVVSNIWRICEDNECNNGVAGDPLRDILFDGNLVRLDFSGEPAASSLNRVLQNDGAQDVTIRNTVFDLRGAPDNATSLVANETPDSGSASVDGSETLSNTWIFDSGRSATVESVTASGSNQIFAGNLVWGQGMPTLDHTNADTLSDSNRQDGGTSAGLFTGGSPFASLPAAFGSGGDPELIDYALSDGSGLAGNLPHDADPAIDQPAYDALRAPISDSARDAGAIEYVP